MHNSPLFLDERGQVGMGGREELIAFLLVILAFVIIVAVDVIL